jgi:hypothetical protein
LQDLDIEALEDNDLDRENIDNLEEDILSFQEDIQVNDDEEYLFPTPDEVTESEVPRVGMVFESLDKSVRFVNVYGKIHGFAVIKGRNHKNTMITLMCNRSRRTRIKNIVDRKRKRKVLDRTNCPMNVTVKEIDEKWHIISCSMEHNHDCVASPSLTKFFLNHRTMSESEIMLSRLLQEIRVKPQSIMTIFRRLKGSFGNITFGKKKMDNLKQA